MKNWSHFALLAGISALIPLLSTAQSDEAASAEQSEQVVLEADNVYEIQADNSIVAEGNVEALYQGRILRADKLIYNRTTEKVRASGNVIIVDTDGSEQFADEIEVDSKLTNGYAIGFSARLAEGSTVAANSAIRQDDGVNALDQVVYTSCPVCAEDRTPTWAIRARRAVLDQQSQMISYRDAVVEVAGIPVFYMPFLAHPDPNSDRRSGFLFPGLGASSKVGVFYKQPYYWAISDHSDLTISPLLSANVNPVLGLDYRKRFYSGEIDIETSFTSETDFDSDGVRFGEEEIRGHLYGSGAFAISPEWIWGFGAEYQSDDLYDRRYDIDGQDRKRGLYSSQPRRLLSQLFLVGQGDDYYADAAILNFQGLRGGDDDAQLPVASPLLFAEKYWNLGDLGFASVNASSAILTRELGADSQRVSVGADWADMNILPGGFTFEPFAEVRADYYGLDEAVSGKDSVTRAVGNAGARLAYPLVRPGKSVDISLEPTLMTAWGFSNTNDPAIPNEDSVLFEFDETSLFEANGFSNYDRYESDAKLSAGLTARAVWKSGFELSTSFGRRWRSRADPTFDVASNLDGTSSDWVATASATLGKPLRIDTRLRLDDDDLKLNRIDMRMTANFDRFRAVGQYYKIDPRISPLGKPDEGIYLRGEAELTDRISLIFGQLRDIDSKLNAQQEFGIAYSDECSRFELAYTRSELTDRTLGPSENLSLRFTLKSIGAFGSSEFD